MTSDRVSSPRRPLENRVPPPLVFVLVAAAMWAAARLAPGSTILDGLRLPLAGALALGGLWFGASGIVALRRARTTTDPVNIDAASSLVTGGIYRITRNPMYVGLTALLLGWTVVLGSPWAALGPVAFVLWITRFQIMPEERVLTAKFGAAYADYRKRVRRWI